MPKSHADYSRSSKLVYIPRRENEYHIRPYTEENWVISSVYHTSAVNNLIAFLGFKSSTRDNCPFPGDQDSYPGSCVDPLTGCCRNLWHEKYDRSSFFFLPSILAFISIPLYLFASIYTKRQASGPLSSHTMARTCRPMKPVIREEAIVGEKERTNTKHYQLIVALTKKRIGERRCEKNSTRNDQTRACTYLAVLPLADTHTRNHS